MKQQQKTYLQWSKGAEWRISTFCPPSFLFSSLLSTATPSSKFLSKRSSKFTLYLQAEGCQSLHNIFKQKIVAVYTISSSRRSLQACAVLSTGGNFFFTSSSTSEINNEKTKKFRYQLRFQSRAKMLQTGWRKISWTKFWV
jgi:hypothetical protein